MASRKLATTVLSPEGVLYQGDTIAVSSTNETGDFSVLPLHANFITIISDKVTLHEDKHTAKEIDLTEGVMSVKENNVNVFVGMGTETAHADTN